MDAISRYEKKVGSIRKQVEKLKVEDPSSDHRLSYLYATANIYHLCPNLGTEGAAFYRMTVVNERQALMDRGMLAEIREYISFQGDLPGLSGTGKGKVFCTYHTGSFYAILFLFGKLGLDISVAVNQQAFDRSKDGLERDVRELIKKTGFCFQVEMVNLMNGSSLYKLANRIRSGRDVLLFVDAPFGVSGADLEKRTLLLDFMEGRIRARKGAAALSFLTGAAMVPLISQRKDDGRIVVQIYPAILPDRYRSMERYCHSATERLFSILEGKVSQNPSQWEGWLYGHSLVHPGTPVGDPAPHTSRVSRSYEYTLNRKRFALLRHRGTNYIFDRQDYSATEISEKVFCLLDPRKREPLRGVEDSLLEYLGSRQIIIRKNT